MNLSFVIVMLALLLALMLRPWRLLKGGALATPMLATLAILPWLWALPRLHIMPVHLQWSGACLVLLMLGWPLAIPVLTAVGLIAAWFAPQPLPDAFDTILWLGVIPVTLAMLLGWVIRRVLGEHVFVYILGRGFLGTVACLFVTGALSQWTGHVISVNNDELSSMVARWLLAWGDGFMTGMFAAIFVAFRPQWLATWSDRLYLRAPPDDEGEKKPVAPALDLGFEDGEEGAAAREWAEVMDKRDR